MPLLRDVAVQNNSKYNVLSWAEVTLGGILEFAGAVLVCFFFATSRAQCSECAVDTCVVVSVIGTRWCFDSSDRQRKAAC